MLLRHTNTFQLLERRATRNCLIGKIVGESVAYLVNKHSSLRDKVSEV